MCGSCMLLVREFDRLASLTNLTCRGLYLSVECVPPVEVERVALSRWIPCELSAILEAYICGS